MASAWGADRNPAEANVIGSGISAELQCGEDPRVVVLLKEPPEFLSLTRGAIKQSVKTLQEGVLKSLQKADYTLVHQYQSLPGIAMIVHSQSALDSLSKHPSVERVDLDQGGAGVLDQSRPWIKANQAHALGIVGSGQTVAVLDSGIDSDHPDLQNDIAHQHCYCTTGTDCCPTGGQTGDGPGSAEDDHGHGTHVAGIITAEGVEAPLGIAPNTKIVAVKVMDSSNSFCCASDISAALDWVLNNRSDVSAINMSLSTFARFSGDCDAATAWTATMGSAVDQLRAAGVLSIAAAGNDSDKAAMGAPACLAGSIAVGATADDSDSVAVFSNSGTSLDVLAPGQSITSTQRGGGFTTFNGTSMAAPHVAALAALLHQRNAAVNAEDVAKCLTTSPVQIGDPSNAIIIRPRIDVPSALDACAVKEVCGGFDVTVSRNVLSGEHLSCTASNTISFNPGFFVQKEGSFSASISEGI